MKKLLSILLVMAFVLIPQPILAEEKIQKSPNNPIDKLQKNTEIFHLEFNKFNADYDVYYLGNTILVYDANGQLLSKATIANTQKRSEVILNTFKEVPEISTRDLISDYNRWRAWYDTFNQVIVFDEVSMTYAICYSILEASFQANSFKIVEGVMQELVNQILGGDMRAVSIAVQHRWNMYCSVLRKERARAGNGYTSPYIYWTANVNDYTGTVETACRILATASEDVLRYADE